jgi:hypothetical protein
VNFEYPKNKAVTLRSFGMSKSGTNLLPKMLLQVAQVRQQFSEFPAFQVSQTFPEILLLTVQWQLRRHYSGHLYFGGFCVNAGLFTLATQARNTVCHLSKSSTFRETITVTLIGDIS